MVPIKKRSTLRGRPLFFLSSHYEGHLRDARTFKLKIGSDGSSYPIGILPAEKANEKVPSPERGGKVIMTMNNMKEIMENLIKMGIDPAKASIEDVMMASTIDPRYLMDDEDRLEQNEADMMSALFGNR